jgi:hypothetical protein
VPAFLHYTRDNPFPAEMLTLGTEARAKRLEYRTQLAALKGSGRVWLVFSHRHMNEEKIITAYAEGLGRGGLVAEEPGAAAYRYDFAAGP